MRSFKIVIACLLLLCLTNLHSQNRSINFDHSDWKSLLAKAKETNKLVFVDCYTTWCGPCKWMAAHVFTNDSIADFYNASFICAKIDMEKGEGLEIAKQYGIQAYPTFIYVNGDGTLIYRLCGSSPVKYFLEASQNALVPEKQIATAEKNFNKGNCSGAQAIQYLYTLQEGCQQTSEAAKNYFNTQKEADYSSKINWRIFNLFVSDYDSPVFLYFEKNQSHYTKLYTADSVKHKLTSVYSDGLYKAIDKSDLATYEALKEKLQKSKLKNAAELVAEADLYYYSVSTDWNNYALTAINYIEKYASTNTGKLNNCAWTFYEHVDNKAQLEKACKWAKTASEKSKMYAETDTYAALLFKTGKLAEAKTQAQTAIERAKKENSEYDETQKLLDKINAAIK